MRKYFRRPLSLTLGALATTTLGGCYYGDVYGAGYGGASYACGSSYYDYDPYAYADGYGYDCYDAADYGSGFLSIGFGGGWYDDYFYPGYGLWMYDNYRNRYPLNGRYLNYWGGRRAWWKHRRDRDDRHGHDGHGGHHGGSPGHPGSWNGHGGHDGPHGTRPPGGRPGAGRPGAPPPAADDRARPARPHIMPAPRPDPRSGALRVRPQNESVARPRRGSAIERTAAPRPNGAVRRPQPPIATPAPRPAPAARPAPTRSPPVARSVPPARARVMEGARPAPRNGAGNRPDKVRPD